VEVAAGFLEKAAPALEYFTKKLTGVDATSWGKDLMDMVLRVSDVLVGAFKSPGAVIQALGMELMAVGAGFMNSMAQTFKYVYEVGSKVFSLISNEVGGTFGTAFKTSWDLFVLYGQKAILSVQQSDAMNSFAALLNTLWDGMAHKGGGFDFDKTFAKFKNAGVAANSEIASDLDSKITAATASLESGLAEGTKKISAKWEEIKGYTGGIKEDVFGAAEMSKLAGEKWKEVSETGKELREQFQGLTHNMLEDVKPLPGFTWDMRNHLIMGAFHMENAADKVKEALTLSEQIINRINEAKGKDAVDPGGRLEARAEAQISKGRFKAAARTAAKISRNEEAAAIAAQFGDPEKPRAFGRSLQDLAKDAGINTFGKTSRQLRSELAELTKKRKGELPPGQQGQPGKPGQPQNKAADPMDAIKLAVEEIRNLVKLIEPKLPTVALGV
jgi:hypothetical protein